MLGFSSQSHYISLFKKEYGITPGEFVALTR
ncbi:MAG: AraC family transcriptional regulator [Eubacterium sp.]